MITKDENKKKVNLFYISSFYILALAISGLFNSGLLTQTYRTITAGYLIADWPFLPAGIGTLIAAILAFKFDKNLVRTVTLLGNDKLKNIAIALAPLLVFSIIGYSNSRYYGFVFSAVALIYAMTEEIFWRNYLKTALEPIGKNFSYLLIGIMWWAWHLRFNTTFDMTAFLLICIVSSYILCRFTENTKSFLTTAGLHSLIIITTTGEFDNSKIIACAAVFLIWISIGKWWKATA
jgi:uncharacterized protein